MKTSIPQHLGLSKPIIFLMTNNVCYETVVLTSSFPGWVEEDMQRQKRLGEIRKIIQGRKIKERLLRDMGK